MEKRQILTLTVLRQKVGLTQVDLALAVGRSQTDISHWEGGSTIPPSKAEAVIAVLRAKDRGALPPGLKPADLSRTWDEVILELARMAAKPTSAPKRHRLQASVGRAAAKARA